MDIGIVVKAIRTKRGWTQSYLAARAGITQASLSQIELNKTFPSRGNLIKVSEALGVNPKVLVLLSGTIEDVPESKQKDFDSNFRKLKELIIDMYSTSEPEDLLDLELE